MAPAPSVVQPDASRNGYGLSFVCSFRLPDQSVDLGPDSSTIIFLMIESRPSLGRTGRGRTLPGNFG